MMVSVSPGLSSESLSRTSISNGVLKDVTSSSAIATGAILGVNASAPKLVPEVVSPTVVNSAVVIVSIVIISIVIKNPPSLASPCALAVPPKRTSSTNSRLTTPPDGGFKAESRIGETKVAAPVIVSIV